ncbi:DMT family transporter [Micromonospora krabiensis]|uniref:Drug/metabolite transporter, DME family n=1 Tax=Micromonospora krabiensis TaxID=307121 RepID=A0A1C3N3M1_9ACTN|nr:EamA family transporter [Micromonospora krabiensis]SBV27146.1 drug/metabolite transporter, DME family [Micromonospora krabiensis]
MSSRRTPSARRTAIDPARAGLIQITLTGVLWGTTGIVVHLVHDTTGLGPVAIGFHRLAIAALVLTALAATRLRPMLAALRAAPLPLVFTGVGLALYQALYFAAVALAGVGVATVVSLGLAPVLTAAWESVRAHRLPGPGRLGTLGAAVVGLALISGAATQPTESAPRPLLGLLAAAGSGLGYAVTTIVSRDVSRRTAPMTLTTISMVIGALTLAPFALTDGVAVPLRPDVVALLLYLGVVTTAVAYALFYAGLRTTEGSVAAVLTLVEPLTAAALAVALLGEPLPAPVLVGGVLLLAAVAATYLTPDRSPAPPTPVTTPREPAGT